MKRHLISLVFVALPFAISSAAQAQQAVTPDQLVGAWKLQSELVHDAATTGNDIVGPLAIGYLTFVREGDNLRVSVNFAERDRTQASGYATDDEALQLFRSYSAYSGIIELGSPSTAEGTPVTTTIDVDLDPHGVGPHARTYRLDGTKLTIVSKLRTITTTALFEKVQ